MRGKMLFISMLLLIMSLFVETASAQANVATLDALIDALKGSEADITVTKTITIDKNVAIDGQGKTVKLEADAYIKLIDSATFEHITIDGGNRQRIMPLVLVGGNGGVTLTLGEGAIIQNARTSRNGGAIELSSAKLQMNGGRILNCTAQNGGGIYLGSDSVVQMDDGIISGCKADGNGGAIFSYVDGGSNEVNLTGGTIEGNSAKIGGGVYISRYTHVEPTIAPSSFRAAKRAASGAEFNRTGGALCGNTATEGGADLAIVSGNLVSLGTPEGQYNGKTVNGWYWDKPNSRYNAQTNSQPYDGLETENVYLIAAYTPVYVDVTFVDALNGTRQSVSAEVGEKIGAKLPGNLKAEGYTFVGWYTAPEGGDALSADSVITQAVTLYARWTKNATPTPTPTPAPTVQPQPTPEMSARGTEFIVGRMDTDSVLTIGHGVQGFGVQNLDYVDLDGTRLGDTQYSAKTGSIIVTVYQDYLNTLSVGDHALNIHLKGAGYEGQTLTRKITVLPVPNPTNLPKTGDGAEPMLWLAALALCAGGLMMLRRRREK